MKCSSYTTPTGGVTGSLTAEVWLPYWHGGFPNDEKDIRSATAIMIRAGTSPTTNIDQLVLTTPGGSGGTSLYPGAAAFCSVVPGIRRSIQQAITLLSASVILTAESNTNSPIVNGVGLNYAIHPVIKQMYQLNILAEDGLVKRDGRPLRYGVEQIRSVIKNAARVAVGVTVYLPDESSHTLVFGEYTEHMQWNDRVKQWRAVITVNAVDVNTTGDTASHSLVF